MARKREKWPPQLSANKAIKIMTKIYSSYGRSVNADLVAPILECSKTSSNFSKRLANLGEFGLITYGKDIVALTKLAERIAAPIDNVERSRAILECFNNVDLLKSLLERFPGGHLPSRENIQNLLIREFGTPKETANLWCDFVEDSFSVLAQTVESPQSATLSQNINATIEERASAKDTSDATVVPSNVIRIPLRKGENRVIIIPDDLSRDEIEWFGEWYDVWEKRPQ